MATLAPSVTFSDSGEFLTAAVSLGSAHSPGYPLFLMYAKPFAWLPFGNIAFRINMATAFSASLACLGAYILTLRLIGKERLADDERFSLFTVRIAALSTACVFAVTPRLWLQSNHDKPYPLLAFVCAIIFYLILLWRDSVEQSEERPAFIYAAAFLIGMSMALHQTVILLVPACFLFMLFVNWRVILKIKESILAAAFALFGFSVHLYLPLRATRNPLLNWGDTQIMSRFMWHFLRKGYPQKSHPRDMNLLWEQIRAFNPVREFNPFALPELFRAFDLFYVQILLYFVILLFSLVIAMVLWKPHKDILVFYLAVVATFLAVIAGHFDTPREMIYLTEEFFTPVYLLTAVLCGTALFYVFLRIARLARAQEHYGLHVYAVMVLLFFLPPAVLLAANYDKNNQRNNYIAYDYATNSLRSLAPNAVLFTWGDSGAFPLWYLQGIERMREDATLPHTPHLVYMWYLNSIPSLFTQSELRNHSVRAAGSNKALRVAMGEIIDRRPLYIDFSTRYSVTLPEFVLEPAGILYRVRSKNDPSAKIDLDLWGKYTMRGVTEKNPFWDSDTEKAILIYAYSFMEAGESLLSAGHLQSGARALEQAEKIAPELGKNIQKLREQYHVRR